MGLDVPVARRAERPAWINVRTVLGLLLFVVALVAGQRTLQAADDTIGIWTATRDLSAGTTLQSGDLRVSRVHLPPDVARGYLAANIELDGAIVTRTIRAGELLPQAWVSEELVSSSAAMTIPVTPEHALGGALRPGDRVDVIATFNAGDIRSVTQVVVEGAEILDVVTAGGLVVGEKAIVGVTIAIDPGDGKRVAAAIRNGDIDLVRIDGSNSGGSG